MFMAIASNFEIHGGHFTVMSNDEEKQIRDWLNAPNCYINFTSAADKKAVGTGKWILNHRQYIKWIEKRCGILWIQGKAGSGKTVLSTSIIDHLSTMAPNATWFHYFDSRDNSGFKSSYRGFLLSILEQIAFNQQHIHAALKTLYENCKRGDDPGIYCP
ncbi:hypothetical protein BT96DRAFT_224851 [Gymnopus androsaceus JB14]|uniref:Nephrocystin 3-like N-terminal domain-containing protein n=1 Tax=Gymnopus androsaceus JB14 TaxID=1447944 RepID=A0A6A4H5G4_9AGAR|nr:hypothetical protein BT96DRAFT_224851 [Gymnopus androsaceus JB14]